MADINVSAIDSNNRATLIALNDTTGLPERLRVDPILNALEIFGVVDDGLTPTAYNHAGIDANNRATLIALNDTTGLIEALRSDTNGVLKVLLM